ncbi:hypothetical protein JCM10212_000376 [Sporobolomyces blumeae]
MANDPPAPSAELKPISSRQLVGHLGHLTDEQQAALDQFKVRLEKDGYFTPPSDGQKPSHDDVTLVRFLRARKFDIQGAYNQFTSAEDWRRKNNVDELYDEFDLAEFNQAASLYPQWTGRRDKTGLPVYVFKVGALTKKATDEYAKDPERLNPRMIALYEHMVQFVLPFCSAIPHEHQEVPISGCATIVDISNVSLMRFWQLKSHMQRASALASANYAETLGAIYLVGAPNFFSTVWGWVKNWFDPGTVEKIFILPSHSVLSTLSTHIDPESIPEEFGGSLGWTYGARSPNLDEPAREILGLDHLPPGPIRWIHADPEGRGEAGGEELKGQGEVVLKGTGRDKAEVERVEKVLEGRKSGTATPATGASSPEASSQAEQASTRDEEPAASRTPEADPSGPSASDPSPSSAAQNVEAVTPSESGANSTTAPPPVGFADATLPTSPTTSTSSPTDSAPSASTAEHNIHIAAMENPGAPVKDLAATLAGTTL